LTALAFVITTVGIVRVASKYLKQIEEEGKKKRANQTTDERNNQHN
jgi:hypothetical protein